MTPILGALIGIVATLIIVAVAIVFIVRTRERDDTGQTTAAASAGSAAKLTSAKNSSTAIDASASSLASGVKNELLSHDDEHNPDVVPNKNGKTLCFVLVSFFFTVQKCKRKRE